MYNDLPTMPCDAAHSPMRRWAHCVLMLLALMWAGHSSAADEYLDPQSAFKFSATMVNPKLVAVTYAIADGYYMYRERFAFKAEGATLGTPVYPHGKVKFDETFQKNVETYRRSVTIDVPVESTGPFTLSATGQGCADLGLCYAPMTSEIVLSAAGGGLAAALRAALPVDNTAQMTVSRQESAASALPATSSARPLSNGEYGSIEAALKSGQLLAIVPLFLLLGLGLAFTPCVLPMVPILSSIIVGEGSAVTRGRGFLLSLTYSLGMAIVYTALGVGAGLLGEGLAATLQNPWVLGAFALLMVGLSLSMFGVYTLQVPGAIQQKLANVSQNQPAGKMVGVFLMGALSALIVGPCVAAPLAGALVYISQTRNVVIGGSALFALAIGMSVPLLVVGLSAGALLPRAGVWMDAVKRCFGVLMLGVALWMVSPVLPASLQMLGWAALGVGYGTYLLWSARAGWVFKALGLLVIALGLVEVVGLASGGRDALQPLAHLRAGSVQPIRFARVKSSADLDAILASGAGKTVLLDFYADWCVSCKEMEKLTFTDPAIRQQLANTVLLQADVTANDSADRALLKRFGLFGPPGIVLFDRGGREIAGSRIIGYQNPARFAVSLAPLGPG